MIAALVVVGLVSVGAIAVALWVKRGEAGWLPNDIAEDDIDYLAEFHDDEGRL